MSISFHDLGCEEYRVRVAADDAGLDAILAAPACTAFLAALKDAREARVSFNVAYAALIASERVVSEDREARLRSTPEGAAFQSAQDAVDEGSAACEAAREALTAARAQEAINRLLGREWVALVDRALVSKAKADLDAATGAMPEIYEVSRQASRALLEACADARRANDLAYSKMVERRRLLRQAHERLKVAAQPLEHIVVLEIRNPL